MPPWVRVAPAGPVKMLADEVHQLLDRDGAVDARREVIAAAGGLRTGVERGHRLGDVVDGDDVEGTFAAQWQWDQARHRPPAQVEGDQQLHGPVERLVPGRLPADRMADDDRGTIDGDRQLPDRGPAESLGFELAPFVRVAEALADVELALEDDVRTITGDVGRTDVIEAPP